MNDTFELMSNFEIKVYTRGKLEHSYMFQFPAVKWDDRLVRDIVANQLRRMDDGVETMIVVRVDGTDYLSVVRELRLVQRTRNLC